MQLSEQIQEQPYERREEQRKKALMHAFVSDREDIVDLKCAIREISKSGCCIATSFIQDLPRIIEITPEGFDQPMSGKIIWRNSKVAGVQFLSARELEEFEREKPVQGHATPSPGFVGKLKSMAGLRRRSGLATGYENRRDTKLPSFGSRVLHGVRNPLTAVKSLLKLLMGDTIRPIPKRVRSIIKAAHKNAEKAEYLLKEALHADKINKGDLPFIAIPVEIVALVNNAALVNTGFAAKHDVRFEVKDDVGEAMVKADPIRIDEVLTNLLSCAAKYSPIAETVILRVTRNDGAIRISISDKGLGSNAWHSDAKGETNTSLDIDICQVALEQHDSYLKIDAIPGSGTTVWFELPELS
jgi:hypothetical protein